MTTQTSIKHGDWFEVQVEGGATLTANIDNESRIGSLTAWAGVVGEEREVTPQEFMLLQIAAARLLGEREVEEKLWAFGTTHDHDQTCGSYTWLHCPACPLPVYSPPNPELLDERNSFIPGSGWDTSPREARAASRPLLTGREKFTARLVDR